MRIECVVPWLGGCEHRERVWGFLRTKYRYPIRMAPGGQPWCKGAAVNPAVAASSADVIVLIDADVWCDGPDDAIRAVENGAQWAVPHTTVRRLTEAATDAVLAGGPMAGQELCQRPYPGVAGGGAVVARREILLDVPIDPRFVGWGQEDASFGHALRTLHGRPWRGEHDLYHLWHPPQERMDRKRGNPLGVALERRYRAARFQPKAMRTLIEEARQFDRAAHQQGMPDRPAVSVG